MKDYRFLQLTLFNQTHENSNVQFIQLFLSFSDMFAYTEPLHFHHSRSVIYNNVVGQIRVNP